MRRKENNLYCSDGIGSSIRNCIKIELPRSKVFNINKDFSPKEFKINEYITLKLEGDITKIYIAGKEFQQCKKLMLSIPTSDPRSQSHLSMDEAKEYFGDPETSGVRYKIEPEQEFWGHVSNIQVWVECDYDTRILVSELSFPILKELSDLGDPIAKKALIKEIKSRFLSNFFPVQKFLMNEGYLNLLSKEDFEEIIGKINLSSASFEMLAFFKNKANINIAKYVKKAIIKYINGGNYSEYFIKPELKKLPKEDIEFIVRNIKLKNITPELLIFLKGITDYFKDDLTKEIISDKIINLQIDTLTLRKFLKYFTNLNEFKAIYDKFRLKIVHTKESRTYNIYTLDNLLLNHLLSFINPFSEVYKQILISNFLNGYPSEAEYIIRENFLDNLDENQIIHLIRNYNYSKLLPGELPSSSPPNLLSAFRGYIRKKWDNKVLNILYETLDHQARGFIIINNSKLVRQTRLYDGEKENIGFNINNDRITNIKSLLGLRNHKYIEFLELDYNKINDITGIEILNNLKILHLNGNYLEKLEPISSLYSLKELELERNLIADISPLKNLTQLEKLNLNENKIANISPLKNLINLKSLNIEKNNIFEISSINSLKNLKFLHLKDNKISDIYALSNLNNLRFLDLWNNKIIDISPLANLTNLHILDLRNNFISDLTPLSNLPKLESLSLSNNKISDVSPLLNLKKLDFVRIEGNPIMNIKTLEALKKKVRYVDIFRKF